jgi:RNA polymerase sigma-70 factor, ECF subfamily
MDPDDRIERFIRLLTAHQNRLFAYLFTLLGDLNESHDVLQEANLVLWRQSAQFAEGTDFWAWSRTVAHFQALAHLRDKKRDRLRFDDDLLEQIAQRPEPVGDDDERRLALRQCLAELSDHLREMISQRYGSGGSVKALARRLGKSESAVKMMLLRTRHVLMHCLRRKLGTVT